MRMPPMAPGHIPKSLSNLTTDEKCWVQVDIIFMSHLNKKIKLLKSQRIVIAWSGFKPGPKEIKPHCVEAEIFHLGKVGFDIGCIPLIRPLQSSLRWNPMGANWNETLTIPSEISLFEGNGERIINTSA